MLKARISMKTAQLAENVANVISRRHTSRFTWMSIIASKAAKIAGRSYMASGPCGATERGAMGPSPSNVGHKAVLLLRTMSQP